MAEVIRVASSIEDFLTLMAEWEDRFADARLHDSDCRLEVEVGVVSALQARLLSEMASAVLPSASEVSVRLSQTFRSGDDYTTCVLRVEYFSDQP